MDRETAVFTITLGLQQPWSDTDVRFDAKAKEIHLEACFKPRNWFAYPCCGAACPPVRETRARIWEHLRFFEKIAFDAPVPCIACSQSGKIGQIPVPLASSGTGFSYLLEALVIALKVAISVTGQHAAAPETGML